MENVSLESFIIFENVSVSNSATLRVAVPSEDGATLFTSLNTSATYEEMITNVSTNPADYIEFIIAEKIDLIYIPIVVILGIIGNVASTFVLLLSSFRESTTCIYLATIEILDTVVLVLCIVFFTNTYINPNVINGWRCPFVYFLFFFVIHFDVLVIICMTAERYIVVRFPLHAHRFIGSKQTIIVILSAGLVSFAINLHSVFIRSMVTNPVTGKSRCWTEGELNVLFMSKVFPWIDSVIYCFFPVMTLFVLNILIIRSTREADTRRLSFTRTQSSSRQQSQVTTMLILVSTAFLVLTAPMAITLIVQRYALIPRTAHEKAVNLLVHAFTDNLMYTNHASNFIFYCISGRRFRKELKKVVCGILLRRKQERDGSIVRPSHSVSRASSVQNLYVIDAAVGTNL